MNVVFGIVTFVLKSNSTFHFGLMQAFATGGFSGVADFIGEKFGHIYDSAVGFKDGVVKALGGMWDFLMTPNRLHPRKRLMS